MGNMFSILMNHITTWLYFITCRCCEMVTMTTIISRCHFCTFVCNFKINSFVIFLLYWILLISLYVQGFNYDRWTLFCSYLENSAMWCTCVLSREQIGSRSILWGVKMFNEAWGLNHLHHMYMYWNFLSSIAVWYLGLNQQFYQ